jgi:hypothetical protein
MWPADVTGAIVAMLREGVLDAALARGRVWPPVPSAEIVPRRSGPVKGSLAPRGTCTLDRSGAPQKSNLVMRERGTWSAGLSVVPQTHDTLELLFVSHRVRILPTFGDQREYTHHVERDLRIQAPQIGEIKTAAFPSVHQANRKLATIRLCPVSLFAMANNRSRAADSHVCIVAGLLAKRCHQLRFRRAVA